MRLFAGLFVGHFAHVPVSEMTKSFLFLLFLFGVGYSVGPQFMLGPQFMQALKRDGMKPILLAVVVCITGLAASILVAKALRLDPGFAAGLMTGALSQSAAIGTATDAINGLALPEADRGRLVVHIAVAHAVCYIFGYAGVIIFCTVIAPTLLLRIDLRAEALKLEQALGMTRANGLGIRLAAREPSRPSSRMQKPHAEDGGSGHGIHVHACQVQKYHPPQTTRDARGARRRGGPYALGSLSHVVLFVAAIIVFVIQNREVVTMAFLGFSIRAPLALVAAGIYVLGAITGGSLFALLRRSMDVARPARA